MEAMLDSLVDAVCPRLDQPCYASRNCVSDILLTLSRSAHGGELIGVVAGAIDRYVANTAGKFSCQSARTGSGRQVAMHIERNTTYRTPHFPSANCCLAVPSIIQF